jgi:hypothetical protein
VAATELPGWEGIEHTLVETHPLGSNESLALALELFRGRAVALSLCIKQLQLDVRI